eukprot:Skav200700  [mRNA]  locus=scaffold4825:82259:85801:- [translate_table: standard]
MPKSKSSVLKYDTWNSKMLTPTIGAPLPSHEALFPSHELTVVKSCLKSLTGLCGVDWLDALYSPMKTGKPPKGESFKGFSTPVQIASEVSCVLKLNAQRFCSAAFRSYTGV